MAYRTKIALWGICALLLTSCAATWDPATTSTVVAGGASALLLFLQSLLESGAITPEQYAELSVQAQSVSTTVDAVSRAMAAIAKTVADLRGQVGDAKAAAEAAWTGEEVLTASGLASIAVGAGVNHLRNKAREVRGEPVGKQHSPTHAAPPSGV